MNDVAVDVLQQVVRGTWALALFQKKLQRPLLPKEHENAKAPPKLAAVCPNCQIRWLAHLLFKPTTPHHR
jgi:hypothetical protein